MKKNLTNLTLSMAHDGYQEKTYKGSEDLLTNIMQVITFFL